MIILFLEDDDDKVDKNVKIEMRLAIITPKMIFPGISVIWRLLVLRRIDRNRVQGRRQRSRGRVVSCYCCRLFFLLWSSIVDIFVNLLLLFMYFLSPLLIIVDVYCQNFCQSLVFLVFVVVPGSGDKLSDEILIFLEGDNDERSI